MDSSPVTNYLLMNYLRISCKNITMWHTCSFLQNSICRNIDRILRSVDFKVQVCEVNSIRYMYQVDIFILRASRKMTLTLLRHLNNFSSVKEREARPLIWQRQQSLITFSMSIFKSDNLRYTECNSSISSAVWFFVVTNACQTQNVVSYMKKAREHFNTIGLKMSKNKEVCFF